MVDLVAGVTTLLNWFLWIALATSVGLLIVALLKKMRGDPDADKLLISGLIVVILGTSGWNLIKILTNGLTFPFQPQYDWVGYVIIGTFFVGSMLYYAVGRKEEGTGLLIACIGAIVVLGLVPQLLSVMGVALSGLQFGAFPVQASADPSFGYPPLNVTLTVQIMDYNQNVTSWDVLVNWGDGTNTSYVATTPTFKLSHVYTTADNYGISVFVKEVGGNGTGVTYTAVAVQTPPTLNVFIYPLQQFLSPIFQLFSSFLSMPFAFIYMSPVFDTNPSSWMMTIYNSVLTFSIAGLGIFWALRLLHGALSSNAFEKEVVDSLKELVAIVAVIASAPYLYNVAVDVLNDIANSLVGQINFAPLYAVIAGVIILGILVGPLSVYMADIAGFISIMFATATAVCLLRYWLIVALILCAPLLCVFYIHPAFRGAVKLYVGLLALLMLAGPVASVLLASLSMWLSSAPVVGSLIYAVSLPIVVAVLPFTILISTTGNFMLGSLGIFRGVSSGIPVFARAGVEGAKLLGEKMRSGGAPDVSGGSPSDSNVTTVTPIEPSESTSSEGSELLRDFVEDALPKVRVKLERSSGKTKVGVGAEGGGFEGEFGVEHADRQTAEEVGAPTESPETLLSRLEELTEVAERILHGTSDVDRAPVKSSKLSELTGRVVNFAKLTAQHMPKHYHAVTGHPHPESYPMYKKGEGKEEDGSVVGNIVDMNLAENVELMSEGFDMGA